MRKRDRSRPILNSSNLGTSHLLPTLHFPTLTSSSFVLQTHPPSPPHRFRPLQWAALNNRVAVASFLLDNGADVSLGDGDKQTALHWACVRGSLPCAELLLRHGAKCKTTDVRGYDAAHVAAQYGHTGMLYHFKTRWDADLDLVDLDGRSPLHWAAYKGFPDAVKLLLFCDCDALRQDKEGCTALHWAAIRGKSEAAHVLGQSGGLPMLEALDSEGSTAARLATDKGHKSLGHFLATTQVGISHAPRSASAIAHHTRLTLSAFIVPDCRRRDFTMNALAYDVQSGLLYDFCGGLDDIDTRIVRTVHRDGPVTSFSEDPARMLRAVRLAARHDFHFAGNVLSAMKASAHLLRKENSARLAGELKALLTRGYSTKAVKLLWETGVLEHVLHLHATHIARAIDPHTTFVAAPPGAFVFAEGDGVVDLVQTGGHTSHNQDLLRGGKEQGSSDGDRAGSIPLDAPWAESGDQNSLGSHKTGSSLTRHGRGGKVRPRISQIPPPRLPIQGPDTFPAKRQSGFPRRRWKRSCVPTRFSKFFARLIERCYPGLITRQPRLATPITDTDTSPKPSPTPASPSRSRWRNLGGRRWSRAGC